MITGFNTDIEHNGVVYHVQTEDKGLGTPLILSLVYDRGTILASKRTPYDDLIAAGFDEKVIADKLQKQHKLMCAAVRNGRLGDLVKMTAKDAATKRAGASPPAPPKTDGDAPAPNANEMTVSKNAAHRTPVTPSGPSDRKSVPHARTETAVAPIPKPPESKPAIRSSQMAPIPQPNEELVWDLPLKILEEEIVVEAVAIERNSGDTILIDAAIEFVEPVPAAETKLRIDFTTKTTFRAGERKTLEICAHRGDPAKRIVGAQIVVKVLGSSFRPLIFHSKTDASGVAVVHLQIPHFRSGRAALLVRALDGGEEAELRQIVRQS